MTVYVDDHYRHSSSEFRGMRMSHMIADTDEELQAMARKLKLRPEWQHNDHYDLAASKRHEALKLGAVNVDYYTCAIMANNARAGWPMSPPTLARTIQTIRFALAKVGR